MIASDVSPAPESATTDVLVPSSLLAHGLGTPLNILAAYSGLLAAGALGPLDGEAEAAVDAMREAAGALARIHDLLVSALPPPPVDAPTVDLVPALAIACRAHQLAPAAPAARATLCLEGLAWNGWERLFALMLAAASVRGACILALAASEGCLTVEWPAAAVGSGDEALAAFLVEGRTRQAGFALRRREPVAISLVGGALRHGQGGLLLRCSKTLPQV
jgi:hypothetical protein